MRYRPLSGQGAVVSAVSLRLRAGAHHDVDALLGARFMRGARLHGYSRVRTAGNHVYNLLFSLAGRRRLHDLGATDHDLRRALRRIA